MPICQGNDNGKGRKESAEVLVILNSSSVKLFFCFLSSTCKSGGLRQSLSSFEFPLAKIQHFFGFVKCFAIYFCRIFTLSVFPFNSSVSSVSVNLFRKAPLEASSEEMEEKKRKDDIY